MQSKNSRRGLTLSRRRFLTLAGLGTGAGLAACAPLATATPVPVVIGRIMRLASLATTPHPGNHETSESIRKNALAAGCWKGESVP